GRRPCERSMAHSWPMARGNWCLFQRIARVVWDASGCSAQKGMHQAILRGTRQGWWPRGILKLRVWTSMRHLPLWPSSPPLDACLQLDL
ncbi:unnamed protein product, partial [Sphagnum balticum]